MGNALQRLNVGTSERQNGEIGGDGIRQTRERIAGSSMRVNIFIGYHSNEDCKSLKIPADTCIKTDMWGIQPGIRGSVSPGPPEFEQLAILPLSAAVATHRSVAALPQEFHSESEIDELARR